MIGQEGVVAEYVGANEAGSGWQVGVWLPDADDQQGESWGFDEDELASVGLTEDESGKRQAAAQASAQPHDRRDEISVHLKTRVNERATAEQIATQAERRVRELVVPRTLSVELERHWHEPGYFEIKILLEPAESSIAAFTALTRIAAGTVEDDGWRCDFSWETGSSDDEFLASGVVAAGVSLSPWSSPERRTPAARLTAKD